LEDIFLGLKGVTMRNLVVLFTMIASFIMTSLLFAQESRLLRNPDISDTRVTFVYAEDIWTAPVKGGEARRLTTFPGIESEPHFSPDGKQIAFSAQYDGNIDVYLIPVEGDEPIRLTWHPGIDLVRGWSPDGTKIVFASDRESTPGRGILKFWTVSLDQKMPVSIPISRISEGKFSPDGQQFVYQKINPWESEFRNYRGGQNNPIRIINLKTFNAEKLPWNGANDNDPVWLDDFIYFLSDRDFTMNVWSYNQKTKELKQVTFFKEFDCKNLESGNAKMIFENSGYLYVLDPQNQQPQKLQISVRGDFPWTRPHWEKVKNNIVSFALSPTGKRAVFEARGEIFTVPEKKGDVRNLTNSSGSAQRAPVWSPNGKNICWFSDEGGEYHLVIVDQFGHHKKSIKFENPSFFYTPIWSPDSKWISYGDADRNLWILNVENGSTLLIDNEGFAHPERTIYPAWSPDSKWIAYTKRLTNQYNTIFIYSLKEKKSFQLTDGLSDCKSPAWDKSGKYLYFISSTDYGLNVGWLDMSSMDRPVKRAIYLAVLSSTEPSPLLPESDDEEPDNKSANEKEEDKKGKKKDVNVTIDFEGINQRILALDIPERDYQQLSSGKEGTIFYMESVPNEEGFLLHNYVLEDRETKKLISGVSAYSVSHDGEKLLYSVKDSEWFITDANKEIEGNEGKIATDKMQMKVNPLAEWKQIFREAWRFQRDYFYVDNVHGLDLDWAYKTYAPMVEHVRHRADLTYILDILGGETSIGHSFTGGGDLPDVEKVPLGLLGADYKIENNRFRISHIYSGENWNPKLRSPLSGPGIDVKKGDYLLSVNGAELTGTMNLYSLFDQTADKQITLKVNSKPQIRTAHEITVVPVKSESALRQQYWIENNRLKVDKLSNGKLAYVWLPNTSVDGYKNFNRYYFAQQDKKGAVIDERFNSGGYIADYIIDLLSRDLMGYFNNPVGNRQPFTAPNAAIWGPKVMIINDAAGSGGDMLPYMFRMKKIGPLVGTRTWGGLVGIWDVPRLIDGGYITAPRGGFYDVNGKWDVENIGIAPDILVEQTPELVNKGHDPQLEKAIEIAMKLLKEKEVKILSQPADPIRVKRAQK